MTRCSTRRGMPGLLVLLALACDQPIPNEPGAAPLPSDSTAIGAVQGAPGVFSDRARLVDPAKFPLLSDSVDLAAGRYDFDIRNGTAPSVQRDDYLVTRAGGKAIVRLVLQSRVQDGDLLLETGPAYWSDVIHSGTYGITMPFDPKSGPAVTSSGVLVSPVTIQSPTEPLPVLQQTFHHTDVCKWVADLLAQLPGSHPPELCGKEHNFEIGAGIGLSVAGTIDSLEIVSGNLAATGNIDISMTVDAGGLTGGHAPVFYPCNLRNYLGCITTPTGAALIDWLRTYAPSIPDASLPPVRLCLPGSPIRVKAGYWDRSGFVPRWVAPVFKRCAITDAGELPTVVLPSFSEALTHVRPHLTGTMVFKVQGDGTLGLKIPIPDAGATAGYAVGNDFTAKAAIGLFADVKLTLKNGGGTFLVSFDHDGVATQQWTAADGWTGDYTNTKTEKNAQILGVNNPDSIVFRFAPEAEASAELCIAIVSCATDSSSAAPPAGPQPAAQGLTDIAIGAKAKVAVSEFEEATWSRAKINPADTSMDDPKIAVDGGYDFTLGAGLTIPGSGFVLPGVPLDWTKTWTCCRVPIEDIWSQGTLDVAVATTGTNPDSDGYAVTVARYDTLPRILRDGVKARLGKARDWGTPLALPVGVNDSARFTPSLGAPCAALYSDAVAFDNPVWGLAVAGLRATGVNVPTYAVTLSCDLLIARYTVTLTGVSENCTVVGGPTQDVWLQSSNLSIGRSGITRVQFAVTCDGSNPVGDLQITTAASTTPDHAGPYSISIDSVPWGMMGPDTTVTLTGLNAGTRTLVLTGGPSNCIAPSPVTVTVTANATTASTISPTCVVNAAGPGQVTISATTTGTGTDLDGYEIKLDGAPSAAVTANGTEAVTSVPALVPSVIQISSIASNCRATSFNPFVVTLDASATPITVPFAASCTSSPVDTVAGTVETATSPTPSVSLRLSDGSLMTLTGPVTAELMQLAGQDIQVRGVTTGSTIDVYGYAFAPSVTEPHWIGIVEQRGADLWLLGEDAIRLIDPPPSLAAELGALVWVTGPRTDTDVTPHLFGVIREAQP